MSWSVLQGPITGYFELDSQGNYDLAIGANPFDENDVVMGGAEIWRYNGSLYRLAAEHLFEIPDGNIEHLIGHYKHDVIYDEQVEGTYYVSTGQGVYKTINNGDTWRSVNKGINIAEFYSLAYYENALMGGTQDLGTIEITGEGYDPMTGEKISHGIDGYDCAYSQLNGTRFTSSYSQYI